MSDDLVREVYRPDGLLPVTKETVSALATALTEARAEIERLRDTNDRVARVDNSLAKQLRASIENNAALVNELSTLRARVREVVGPFARADVAIGSERGPFRFETGTGYRLIEREDLAAARQLMEEVK